MVRSISALSLIYLAVLFLVLPIQWVLGAIVAAGFHEFCHYTALRVCGVRLRRLSITPTGAQMQTGYMSEGKELICALSGPLGSLSLLFLARWFPRIAICGMAQGLYNLLPVMPLDGGRILRCISYMTFRSAVADKICIWIRRVSFTVIFMLGIYASVVMRFGLFPFTGALFVIFRACRSKCPCKLSMDSVQ